MMGEENQEKSVMLMAMVMMKKSLDYCCDDSIHCMAFEDVCDERRRKASALIFPLISHP